MRLLLPNPAPLLRRLLPRWSLPFLPTYSSRESPYCLAFFFLWARLATGFLHGFPFLVHGNGSLSFLSTFASFFTCFLTSFAILPHFEMSFPHFTHWCLLDFGH